MKRITVAVFMVMLMSFCSVSSFAQEKVAQPEKKVYSFYLGDHGSSYVLQDLEATEFNGVKCIKGTHADITWVKNRTVYVPVDKIEVVVEYDSLKQYKDDVAKFHEKRMESD